MKERLIKKMKLHERINDKFYVNYKLVLVENLEFTLELELMNHEVQFWPQ